MFSTQPQMFYSKYQNPQNYYEEPSISNNSFINIEKIKSKYSQNIPQNVLFNKTSMIPNMNIGNEGYKSVYNNRYNPQNPIHKINPFSNTFIPRMQIDPFNGESYNPKEEIEKIKKKYFTQKTTNNFSSNLMLIEEKINKYKDYINNNTKLTQLQNFSVKEEDKHIPSKNFEINRVNDIEIKKDDNNELLLSKVSWMEGKISTSTKFNIDNTIINNTNMNNLINSCNNNKEVNYSYSNSENNNSKEEDEQVNDNKIEEVNYYDEILPIIDKVSKLKEIERNEDDNPKESAKIIVNNILNKMPLQKSQEENENEKTNYLNMEDLEVVNNKMNNNIKEKNNQPKLLPKKQLEVKKKVISFEEFLLLNED